MIPLYSMTIPTGYGEKTIAVYNCNILDFDEPIDILTASAFKGSYYPTPRTVFYALHQVGISIMDLAKKPMIDLRSFCNVWLSDAVESRANIKRIGCVEMLNSRLQIGDLTVVEQELLNSIRAYFQMLDIAATCDVPMETVALPLLGSGSQAISGSMILIPVLNECVDFLKRSESVKRICFVEMNTEKAELIAFMLKNSYQLLHNEKQREVQTVVSQPKAMAFISYASPDKNIADNLCAKLEKQNVKVWYAPRDVVGPYAAAITDAISRSTHFVVILSRNSIQSQHVLNEIDLAFQGLPDKIKFKPLRIDDTMFTPSFKYYLSRQHWMDAINPPLEARLDEFVGRLIADL